MLPFFEEDKVNITEKQLSKQKFDYSYHFLVIILFLKSLMTRSCIA